MIELDITEALAAAGHALILASLAYFFYLLLKHCDLPHVSGHEGDRDPTLADRPSYIAAWLGEPEHGQPGRASGNTRHSGSGIARFRDSA
jgi:hypothetical protein